ncbi:MAG: NAD-dependent DNA ligase LigA [Chlamydiia bacterium]|nr:NAD-dependent DNA ligase LigA [Chlamydiia bacterium]
MEKRSLKRYLDLVEKVIEWDISYRKGSPSVSDSVYDAEYKRLKDIEHKNPEIIVNYSPTISLSHLHSKAHANVQHRKEMKSIENCYTKEDLSKFFNRITNNQDDKICAEYKLDGAACAVRYKNGKLISVATRGDGSIGEEITFLKTAIDYIPDNLSVDKDIEIYGELVISKEDFDIINKERELSGFSSWANSRNLVAGSTRLKDLEECKRRRIRLIAYSLCCYKDFSTQKDINSFLGHQGFRTNEILGVYRTVSCAEKIIEDVASSRNDLDYSIDGIVFKNLVLKYREELGSSHKLYKWQVAYKLPAECCETIVRDVIWQVGATGRITPVACVDKIAISGVNISRVTLHNFSEIVRRDLHIGDIVGVERGGDVIPKVSYVRKECRVSNAMPILLPDKCPGCGSPALVENEGKLIRCMNKKNCKKIFSKMLENFVSKNCMDIEFLGKSLSNKLMSLGIITSFEDIYTITVMDLQGVEGIGSILANLLIGSISKSKNRSPDRLFAALGIDGVGVVTAKMIMRKFNDILEIPLCSIQDFLCIKGIGETVSNNIFHYFQSESNRRALELLISLGAANQHFVCIERRVNKNLFCVSGSFEGMTRDIIKSFIEDKGHIFTNTLTKKCNYLICGDSAGSKVKKAEDYGIRVISWNEAMDILMNS